MHKEEPIKKQAEQLLSRISEIGFQLKAKKERVEAKLEELRKTLPDILSDCALGLIPREKVDEVKEGIRECEEFLRDYSLVNQGLDRKGLNTATLL